MLPAMRVLAVPVKSLERAKNRLSSVLSLGERAALSLVMFEDVLDACLAQPDWETWVVSRDEAVLEIGARRANELRLHLNQLLSNQPVEILAGNRIIEIRPHGIHKGRIVPPLPTERLATTTVVAIGDDRTDEDLFAALPPEAITIRVGSGLTRAHYRLDGIEAVRSLLQMVVDAGVGAELR